jgi:FKBP-type peptidyl-prolyl cis-trans isomerase 2
MTQVKENDVVKVHYTGKLENGQIFDSSQDREPLEFTVGEGKIIPGIENAVIGMNPGDNKEVTVSPENAYGEYRDDMIGEIPKEQLPEDIEPQIGMELVARNEQGDEQVIRIKEIKDSSIVIDANHPLAGEKLYFNLQLLEVNPESSGQSENAE